MKERPSATFCNEKYSVLNDFCYADFLAYYTLENKSNQICEYQPDELDNNLIENIQDRLINGQTGNISHI